MIMHPSTMLRMTIAALALSLCACGDDDGGSGGNGGGATGGSSTGGGATGAGASSGGAAAGGSSAGGGGGQSAGGAGTGAVGTGATGNCARCGDALGASFPVYCDLEAEQLYDTLESCMCTFACTQDCEFDACTGSELSTACLDCLDANCQPQLDECLADK